MNQVVLNTAVTRVKDALQKKGLAFEIKQFSESTRTANEAAAVIGCQVAQIMKSLLFRMVESKQPILIFVSGKNRVNEQSIEALVGEKIVKADADFTREITGFTIGGIPPLENEKFILFLLIKIYLILKPCGVQLAHLLLFLACFPEIFKR